MPRRVVDYALIYADWNMLSSLGGFFYGMTQLLFVYIVFQTIHGGEKVAGRVWEGARGLEWTLPSPAPYHSFATPPEVRE